MSYAKGTCLHFYHIDIIFFLCIETQTSLAVDWINFNQMSSNLINLFLLIDKAMLSIFYGRRVLRRAKIVPDKKKKLTFKHFFIFSSDILKVGSFTKSVGFLLKYRQNLNFPLSGSVDHRIYWEWSNIKSLAVSNIKAFHTKWPCQTCQC